MKITEQIKTIWRAVNGSKRMQLAGADARLYATLETALNQYAGDAR
jgi:hypothetical protein